jgi:cell division protein FtsI/penicillin-binding protein 2
VVLPARRGLLADRNGRILARNIAVADVIVDRKHLGEPNIAALGLAYDRVHRAADWSGLDPAMRARRVLKERDRILEEVNGNEICTKALSYAVARLAKPLGLHPDEMRRLIEDSRKGEFVLVQNLQGEAAEWAEEEARNCWIQGFRFTRSYRRVYPVPDLATHVVGFADDSYRGKCGAEAALDGFLCGRAGERVLKRDSRGLLLPAHAGHLIEPRPGLNVQLTLDLEIQAIVEEELERGLAEFNSVRGAALVLDPHTGEVLAMASRPHFHLNHRDDVEKAGVNFALQAVYEPGSTFKIIAVSGALDAGLVGPKTLVNCHGGYYREGVVEVRDDHPSGTITVEGVVQRSSNIGAYVLGRQLGQKRFFEMAEGLGFGR